MRKVLVLKTTQLCFKAASSHEIQHGLLPVLLSSFDGVSFQVFGIVTLQLAITVAFSLVCLYVAPLKVSLVLCRAKM